MTRGALSISLAARSGLRAWTWTWTWGLAAALALPGGMAAASDRLSSEAVARFVDAIAQNGNPRILGTVIVLDIDAVPSVAGDDVAEATDVADIEIK